MIIQKPFSEGDVVTIKNTLGEEIIAEFKSETADTYYIRRPVVIAMMQQGIGFMPAMVSAEMGDSELAFSKANALWPAMRTNDELAKAYTEHTTGIALATSAKTDIKL